MDNKKKYFSIVGPDGAGKDSVITELFKRVDAGTIVLFREPGGNKKAEVIREVILTVDDEKRRVLFKQLFMMDFYNLTKNYISIAYEHFLKRDFGFMEVFLYAASRNETNKDIVEKNLAEGKHVLGSRSISCSMAYQAKARGIGYDFVWKVNEPALTRLPDFEIFLDIDTETSMKRIKKRTEKQDRLDKENAEFHRLSREGYLEFYERGKFPTYIIDASGSIEENTDKVLQVIKDNNIL